MAATLVVATTVGDPPHLALTLSGMAGSTVTITRNDTAGNQAVLRTADEVALVSGGWVGNDYELPYGTQFWYQAVSDSGDTATSALRSIPVDGCWLVHPGVPSLSQRVHPRLPIADRVYALNRGVHAPLGRTRAIVITDGVRQAPAFDLVLKTKTDDQLTALRNLLSDGSPLLLRIGLRAGGRTDTLWISGGDLAETAPVGNYEIATRYWSMPCNEVDPPTGNQQAQFTWADIVATYGTWSDVLNAYGTWSDVVFNRTA